MTRRTNARVAGFAFLLYIAAALSGMILSSRAASGEGIAAKLAGIAQHAPTVRLAVVLELVGCFCALVLAVTLYAITREQWPALAMLALICRVVEAVSGEAAVFFAVGSTLFFWLMIKGVAAPSSGSRRALEAA